jgi:hypothetical protein
MEAGVGEVDTGAGGWLWLLEAVRLTGRLVRRVVLGQVGHGDRLNVRIRAKVSVGVEVREAL